MDGITIIVVRTDGGREGDSKGTLLSSSGHVTTSSSQAGRTRKREERKGQGGEGL